MNKSLYGTINRYARESKAKCSLTIKIAFDLIFTRNFAIIGWNIRLPNACFCSRDITTDYDEQTR